MLQLAWHEPVRRLGTQRVAGPLRIRQVRESDRPRLRSLSISLQLRLDSEGLFVSLLAVATWP